MMSTWTWEPQARYAVSIFDEIFAGTPATVKSAWVFGASMKAKASGRLDVYTQDKQGSDF